MSQETQTSTAPRAADASTEASGDASTNVQYAEYGFESAAASHTHRYLWPVILDQLGKHVPSGRILDAGCGNGAFCGTLAKNSSYQVFGVDLSETGIEIAQKSYPAASFRKLSVSDDLVAAFGGPFDGVVSLEVVEHLYSPAGFVESLRHAIKPGGYLIMSTPYHGYLKNLLLAATGRLDKHFTALWEGGHIKFWSRKTLSELLEKNGFTVVDFAGCGRLPYLWMSMVLTVRRED